MQHNHMKVRKVFEKTSMNEKNIVQINVKKIKKQMSFFSFSATKTIYFQ